MRRAIIILAMVLGFAATARGQGYGYTLSPVAPSATVNVCTYPNNNIPCTSLAAIYTTAALSTPITLPDTLSSAGTLTFYAAAGTYVVDISGTVTRRFIITLGPPPVINGAIPIYTVATLPSGQPTGTLVSVKDGASSSDCTTGSGTTLVLCGYGGSSWASVGGGGGGSSAFSAITGSTNTTAAMIVGSGASLRVSGTGTNNATALNGTAFAGTTNDLVSFGAANIPNDTGVLAGNLVTMAVGATGVGHFSGATKVVTSSPIVAADITNGTITSVKVDNSIALTGTDINTSNQVTATHLASALPVNQGGSGVATQTSNVIYKGNGTGAEAVSSITDNATTVTSTDTGGFVGPLFTSNGAGAGFWAPAQGADNCVAKQPAGSVCWEAPASGVTSYHGLFAVTPSTGIPHYSYSSPTITQTISLIALASDVSGQLPIGAVGSSGLSGTLPISISAAGAISNNPTAHNLSAPLMCAAASGSGTAYTCTTSPSFTPADGDVIQFQADVASTGAVTLNVNSTSAAGVKKQGGTTALVANDFIIGQDTLMEFDGVNWQMQGQLGNAPAVGSVTGCSFTGGLISCSGSTTVASTVAGTSGGIPYFSGSTTWASTPLLTQYGVLFGGGSGGAPTVSAQGALNMPLIGQGAANPIFSTIAYPTSLTSGGFLYASSTTAFASSALITANVLPKSGGAGAAPLASLLTDAGTTLTYAGTGGVSLAGSAPAVVTPGTTPYLNMNTLVNNAQNKCTFAFTVSTFTLALSPLNLCTFTLPNAATTWAWSCSAGWSNPAGTTPTFAVGVNWAQAPSAAFQMANIYTTNAEVGTQGSTASTSNANILATGTIVNAATIFQTTFSGTFTSSATSGQFHPTASLTGTGATGTMVGSCTIQ